MHLAYKFVICLGNLLPAVLIVVVRKKIFVMYMYPILTPHNIDLSHFYLNINSFHM